MTLSRGELADRLGAVAIVDGSFRLRSGLTTTRYFDKYRFEADPGLLAAVAEQLSELVPDGIDVLAGLELGGVPVATALSLVTGLPTAFIRKQAKEYGTARLAEGADIDGRRVLVVEDVVTTGGQVVRSSDDLRERGAIVSDALCVVDRQQGGREALGEMGITLTALVTGDEVGL